MREAVQRKPQGSGDRHTQRAATKLALEGNRFGETRKENIHWCEKDVISFNRKYGSRFHRYNATHQIVQINKSLPIFPHSQTQERILTSPSAINRKLWAIFCQKNIVHYFTASV